MGHRRIAADPGRALASSLVTFTLFEAAYFAEIMRAGIQSIPRGQVSAAQALGMTYLQTMGYIVLPQAFRNMLPVLLTQTIILFQDTSLVYVLSITDFLGAASKVRAAGRTSGRDVPVRGAGLFRHLVRGLAAGAPAASDPRSRMFRKSAFRVEHAQDQGLFGRCYDHAQQSQQVVPDLPGAQGLLDRGRQGRGGGGVRPSGSGKSTLIKCVNGLEPFQEGTITVAGISVGDRKTDLPKLRARIGMVFQHFELFPHLTVMRNRAGADQGAGPRQG